MKGSSIFSKLDNFPNFPDIKRPYPDNTEDFDDEDKEE